MAFRTIQSLTWFLIPSCDCVTVYFAGRNWLHTHLVSQLAIARERKSD